MRTPRHIQEELNAQLSALHERTRALADLGRVADLKPGVASADAALIRHATIQALATARAELQGWTQTQLDEARLAFAQTDPTPTDEARLARYTNSVDSKAAAEARLMGRARQAFNDGNYSEARLLAMAAASHGATGSERFADACTGIIDMKDGAKAAALGKRNAAIVQQTVAWRDIDAREVTALKQLAEAAAIAGDTIGAASVRAEAATRSAGSKVRAAVESWQTGEPYAGPDSAPTTEGTPS